MLGLLRSLLLENLGIKLVALLLAIALYLHVYTERPASMLVSFPLEITDLADTLTLSGAAPEPVRAELRGTGKQLIRLRLTEPRLKVSLAGVGPGHYERTVVPDDLPLLHDENLEVQRMASSRVIALDIERRLTRRLPLAIRISGAPHAGWRWDGRYAVDPPQVVVRGPWREVARLDSIRLKPVRLEGRTDSVKAITSADSLPRWCTTEPLAVRVLFALTRATP